MDIKVINAGNCMLCGKEIKIVARRGNNKFPDIFFCPECERKRINTTESEDKEITREEAIARIENHKILHKMNEPRAIYISEALDMAIKALEQEPCDDVIAILTEIQTEINEAEIHRYDDQIDKAFNRGLHKGSQLIQLKIDKLKENKNGNLRN